MLMNGKSCLIPILQPASQLVKAMQNLLRNSYFSYLLKECIESTCIFVSIGRTGAVHNCTPTKTVTEQNSTYETVSIRNKCLRQDTFSYGIDTVFDTD